MAEEAPMQEADVAVMERFEITPPAGKKRKNKKQKDDPIEHEIEFSTPFGRLEFELEPTDAKQKRDERKREKQQADNERARAKAAKKDAKRRDKAGMAVAEVLAPRKSGSTLIPVLIIFGLIIAAIALAVWLFARPGDEAEDAIPDEFRNPEAVPAVAEPQGFAAKAQQRIRQAVRAGKQASREAQAEQEKRFQDLTSGG